VPADRLLVETDTPYLAPVPHRGRANEPAYVVEVARRLAEELGWSMDRVELETTRSFFGLFTRARREDVRA
jgi:TatD DNase family protein